MHGLKTKGKEPTARFVRQYILLKEKSSLSFHIKNFLSNKNLVDCLWQVKNAFNFSVCCIKKPSSPSFKAHRSTFECTFCVRFTCVSKTKRKCGFVREIGIAWKNIA